MKYENSITNIATTDVAIDSSIPTISDNIRTSNGGFDSFSNNKLIEEKHEESDFDNNEINVNIFRFKFKDEFTGELYKFAKIHQYDHRKDFKEAWKIWLEENTEIVEEEVRRLTNLRYDGDILDKMFKSARYYFRKKSTEKKNQQSVGFIMVYKKSYWKLWMSILKIILTIKTTNLLMVLINFVKRILM